MQGDRTMKKSYRLLILPMLLFMLFNVKTNSGYIPDQEIVFDQQFVIPEVEINHNLTIGIFVKNYMNYTLSNVSISLNLTTIAGVEFTSCDFGVLLGDNLTLETPIQSSSENDFTSVDITYGFMKNNFLRFNVTEILNETKMIFYYNITAGQEGRIRVPTANMIYLDNWEDEKVITSRNQITVQFLTDVPNKDPNLPDWSGGVHISVGLGVVVFAVIPAFIAITSGLVLYFRRR